jgi:hypothetical protein
MFVTGFAAAEGSAVTATVAAVSIHSATTAAAANGRVISRADSGHNAAANIVFLAGVCQRRAAATAASPYFISSKQ